MSSIHSRVDLKKKNNADWAPKTTKPKMGIREKSPGTVKAAGIMCNMNTLYGDR